VTGNYTQGAGGTLAEEITGTALSAFDRLLVSGNASLNGTLAIDSSSFTPAPTDTFQFLTAGGTLSGAFSNLTGEQAGARVYLPVYDSDGSGGDSATLVVQQVGAPSIPATGTVGQQVSCDPGTWTGAPTFSFQWTRNGTPIGGATSQSYTLVAADAGTEIRCVVTGSYVGVSSAQATSNALAVSGSAPPPPPPPPPVTAPPAIENPQCAVLRAKLKKAKAHHNKHKVRKIRRQLRHLGC
jgi:hypothetical protein